MKPRGEVFAFNSTDAEVGIGLPTTHQHNAYFITSGCEHSWKDRSRPLPNHPWVYSWGCNASVEASVVDTVSGRQHRVVEP